MIRHGKLIYCDHPGCPRKLRGKRHPNGAVTSVRRLAHDCGWSRSPRGC